VSSYEERRLLEVIYRRDLASFIHRTFQTVSPANVYQPNWHIKAMAWHLQQCQNGMIKRLLITLPPRYLKSICASVAYPAWVLGHDPSKRIICASFSENLASKHAGDCRAVIESDWYRRVFPSTRISRDKNAELNFVTTRHGGRYSTSVGGTLTGRGGSLVIIDDPIKPDEAMSEAKRGVVKEWFDRTLYSRLDSKRDDVIILIMQRLHLEDLAGYVLPKEHWTLLNLPAIADAQQRIQIGEGAVHIRKVDEVLHEERESREVLNEIKRNMGSFAFSAQYQQNPLPPDGEMIKWSWFRFYSQRPERAFGDTVVQSWDTASKAGEASDFSVCTTWMVKGNQYYLLDIVREKLLYPDLKRRVIEHARLYEATSVLIEDKGSGTSLIDDLRQENADDVVAPIAILPEGDKLLRLSAQSAKVEAGQVHLPKDAIWLSDFKIEVLQFPRGTHDDQVDSLSQFLNWIERRCGNDWSVEELSL
jgi:predicted phage terminase large subunit-like protein